MGAWSVMVKCLLTWPDWEMPHRLVREISGGFQRGLTKREIPPLMYAILSHKLGSRWRGGGWESHLVGEILSAVWLQEVSVSAPPCPPCQDALTPLKLRARISLSPVPLHAYAGFSVTTMEKLVRGQGVYRIIRRLVLRYWTIRETIR